MNLTFLGNVSDRDAYYAVAGRGMRDTRGGLYVGPGDETTEGRIAHMAIIPYTTLIDFEHGIPQRLSVPHKADGVASVGTTRL